MNKASEFIKQVRKFVKMYKNEIPRRAEITFLNEACDIIDSAESINKDLVDACEQADSWMTNAKHSCEIPMREEYHRIELIISAAIAKSKKEGEG